MNKIVILRKYELDVSAFWCGK